ncbi:MAG: serine hydrolase [Cyanobacteria bacterium]|nr:serine hydrolase [Cyanobacteriota bacterium]MDA1020239.1 serine hydrolase [Cyanobacteriota bacterium]
MQLQNLNLKDLINAAIQQTVPEQLDADANVSLALFKLGALPMTYYHLHGDENYHPASLIKLFQAYLAKYTIQSNVVDFAREKIAEPDSFASLNHMEDVYQAIEASLKDSDNDALSYLVDYNSGTCSGPRLGEEDFAAFKEARGALSEFFHERGYTKSLNIPGKCFSFAPYGRETQLSLELGGLGRNSMSVQDAVQIIYAIKVDFPELLELMKRELDDTEDEQTQFIAKGLRDYKNQIKAYYSKAGWTSKVRHDVAYLKMQTGEEFILAIMTKNLSECVDLIPAIAQSVFAALLRDV